MDAEKLRLWDEFSARHQLNERAVPLFECDAAGRTVAAPFGRDGRLVLRRSAAMEDLLAGEVERAVASPAGGAGALEGVLYMMHWRDPSGRVLPLYVGRAGRYGRGGGKVSANLRAIHANGGKFARWGSNYAYHIGDLSAASCPGHSSGKVAPKYRRWADRLFADAPAPRPALRRPVFFWAAAWGPGSYSIWSEFGACSLAFEEYLLIGVASELFPDILLNDEGVNRAGPRSATPE